LEAPVIERPTTAISTTDQRGRHSGRKIVDALRAATKPRMVQVAIGQFVPAAPGAGAETCLARFVLDEASHRYTLVPDEIRMVRLNSRTARLLGFDGQWHTLWNLGEAGFVEIVRVAPHVRMLNLDSWFNHLRRCAEDPYMWDAGSPCCEEYLKARRSLRRCGMASGEKRMATKENKDHKGRNVR
jgi:hypothetical protein